MQQARSSTAFTEPWADIRSRALNEIDHEMSARLGIPLRDLTERREQLDKMYSMIQTVVDGESQAIVGSGFHIKNTPEGIEVFRRGFGVQRVARRVSLVAALFSPAVFWAGL